MGAGTDGRSDTMLNKCGNHMAHAYSIIAAFNMTDDKLKKTTHNMLLIRNPWG